MDFHISLGGKQLASGVYAQLRAAILDGRLRPGDSLPATRELARRLSVSRNTVTAAYQRLSAEGFLVGRVGAGTFVAADVPALKPRRAPAGSVLRPHVSWRVPPVEAETSPELTYDLRIGTPDAKLFPWDVWRRLLARQLRPASKRSAGGLAEPAGHPRLRQAIARYTGIARSVRAGPEDVLVTSGAQQAFDLIARVLLGPGACAAVEDPGYPQARRAFLAAGARVVPVPVDAEGLQVEKLPKEARLVYVTPSHQFPLGMPMSLARRAALLQWAERHGAAILEDDYDSELRLDGRPLEPLQSLDRSGRVLYVGTFSKVLLPALRLGFLVAPPSLMPALQAAKAVADSHGAQAPQAALAELIDSGLLGRHIRRVLRTYSARRDRLVLALGRELRDTLEVLPASAGLHLSAWLRDRRADAQALSHAAAAAGVAVQPLTSFFLRAPRAGLAFGYGNIPLAKLDEAVRRLAGCVRSR